MRTTSSQIRTLPGYWDFRFFSLVLISKERGFFRLGTTLSAQQQEELSHLKSGRSRLIRGILVIFAILALTFIYLTISTAGDVSISMLRRDLLSSRLDWAVQLAEAQRSYATWLDEYSLVISRSLFDSLSAPILLSASQVARTSEGDLGFLGQAYVSVHGALLRIGFLILAALPLWSVTIIMGIWRAQKKVAVYRGPDLLGQTGNGKAYFSGIRADLSNVNQKGVPELFVTGLACPQRASPAQVKTSALGRLLLSKSAVNGTNLELAAIIEAYPSIPSYACDKSEEALLHQSLKVPPLGEGTILILEQVCALYQEYRTGEVRNIPVRTDLKKEGLLNGRDSAKEQFPILLRESLHRVLTPSLRKELSQIPLTEIATVVLAVQSGKVFAYANDGSRWYQRSQFPHLSARAALHSCPSLGREYSVDQRSAIRQALVYGKRSSVFAPVRFPMQFPDKIRALRQWVEVLLAPPHELQHNSNEVELFGIVSETHRIWNEKFFDGIVASIPEVIDGSIATQSNLLFVPLRNVVSLLRKCIAPETIRRIETLLTAINSYQRVQSMTLADGNDELPSAVMVRERVLAPLNTLEIKKLIEHHEITEKEAREWSALRSVVSSFGWLAKRVGDYSVPESGVIYTVFKVTPGEHGTDSLGIFGKSGMVPFRATRLAEKWGKGWATRFPRVLSATMAENKEDFNRKLQGIEESVPDDEMKEEQNSGSRL